MFSTTTDIWREQRGRVSPPSIRSGSKRVGRLWRIRCGAARVTDFWPRNATFLKVEKPRENGPLASCKRRLCARRLRTFVILFFIYLFFRFFFFLVRTCLSMRQLFAYIEHLASLSSVARTTVHHHHHLIDATGLSRCGGGDDRESKEIYEFEIENNILSFSSTPWVCCPACSFALYFDDGSEQKIRICRNGVIVAMNYYYLQCH